MNAAGKTADRILNSRQKSAGVSSTSRKRIDKVKKMLAGPLFLCLSGCSVSPRPTAPIPVSSNSCRPEALLPGLYVSPNGDDANPGTAELPLATIGAALALVRRQSNKPVVYLRGGTYELQSPLVLTAEDSGLSLQGVSCETAIVSGGHSITGWKKVSDQIWQASTSFLFHQMFVDGQRLERARTRGFMQVDGLVNNAYPISFKFHSGDLSPRWAGAEIVLLQTWGEDRLPIETVDTNTLTVTLRNSMVPWMLEANARYYVESASDLVRFPGQWYLDEQKHVVSYMPRPGEDPSKQQITGSNLERLVTVNGASNLTFSGLTFSYTDWKISDKGYVNRQTGFDLRAAIEGEAAQGVQMTNNRFEHLGENVAHFFGGSQHIVFDKNQSSDIGGGGVWLGDGCTDIAANPNAALAGIPDCDWYATPTADNEITRNVVRDIGQVFPASAGIGILQSSNNRVCSNEVFNTYQTAISVGWTWGYGRSLAHDNLIAFNHVHDIGRGMLSDMGGIYTLGVQPGTVVRNNLIHDVTAYLYGGRGLYQDEGSSHILTESNIVYRAHSGSFVHNSDGEDNVVRNNLLALADSSGQLEFAVSPPLTREPQPYSVFLDKNTFYWSSGPLMIGDWSTSQFGTNVAINTRQDLNHLIQASAIQTTSGGNPCNN